MARELDMTSLTPRPLFSETDVRLLVMTVSGVAGCIVGFIMGLVAAR